VILLKNRLLFLLVFFVLLLGFSGCTPSHYGVAEEDWQRMNDEDRAVVIKEYNTAKRLRTERRLEEEKARQLQEQREMHERNTYIDSIYSGQRGAFGDLLRVSFKGGKMRFPGKHREFRPFSFKIADRECKKVEFVGIKSHRSTHSSVQVCYEGGTLLIDVAGRGQDYGAGALVYEGEWSKGASYPMYTDGRAELKNVQVSVSAVSPQGHVVDHRVW
jgi:predicted Fe-S protein YdhL (DUF1289 family)